MYEYFQSLPWIDQFFSQRTSIMAVHVMVLNNLQVLGTPVHPLFLFCSGGIVINIALANEMRDVL